MNFGIVNVITDDEVQTLKEQIYGLKKFWKQRINWHPANDTGSEEDLERYVHYYTLGTTLYMDASDYGFRTYWRSKSYHESRTIAQDGVGLPQTHRCPRA